jgi:nitrogen fixation/metabolism regulation signal transduction histidine kinase
MISIRTKIRLALVGSISVIAVFAVIMQTVTQLEVLQNQQIIKTMTMEYSIISSTDELIRTYNDVVKNTGNTAFVSEYNVVHKKLRDTMATLKIQITRPGSKALMFGVENTVNQVVTECDGGLFEVQNNNFQNFSDHFSVAHKNNEFVIDNVRSLLQKELEYLSQTQTKSEQFYVISVTISIVLFFIIFILMIIFAQRFSKQLTSPLIKLSFFAKEIANGNIQNQEKRTLKITNDEIGSLT